ncbi:MAG TPA: DNA-3-methyladenine glycosylase I [Candidatus Limnocylindria bacterium]|nr:DNA-3-methyladenine glycosylase I [Candidatus Limnocylindria bacterium]
MSAGLADARPRCDWAGIGDSLYRDYHDREWGVPLHDDRRLFELLLLEGAQAGLAWISILRRREGYRAAFHDFDPTWLASLTDDGIASLLGDPRIVRNRAKIRSAVGNARAFLALVQETGSFDGWLWSFVDGGPMHNAWRSHAEIPAETDLSRSLSAEMRRRGFSFIGPTIAYAFMQSAGLVNDHLVACFRHDEVAALR